MLFRARTLAECARSAEPDESAFGEVELKNFFQVIPDAGACDIFGPFVEQISRSSLTIVSGRPAAVGMFSLGLICVIFVTSSRGRLNVQR